jgi:hypothetical protein
MTPTAPWTQSNFVASQVGAAIARASSAGVIVSDEEQRRLRVDAIDLYQSRLSTLTGYPVGSNLGDQSPAR